MKIEIEKPISIAVETSINYVQLKYQLYNAINDFCKEQLELRSDLHSLRNGVGDSYNYEYLKNIADILSQKYNTLDNRIGIDWHIEKTRYDYSLIIVAVIQRGDISVETFIFRYKRADIAGDIMTFSTEKSQ